MANFPGDRDTWVGGSSMVVLEELTLSKEFYKCFLSECVFVCGVCLTMDAECMYVCGVYLPMNAECMYVYAVYLPMNAECVYVCDIYLPMKLSV